MKNWAPRTVALALTAVMLVTVGCTSDALDGSKQLSLSGTPVQHEKQAPSYTDTVTNKLGSYYDSTVAFLTDDCGVGAYSVATGKAVFYGLGGGLWGASKGSLYGLWSGDSVEGLVIGSVIGSGVGLAVGVKEAYDGFEVDTANCNL